MYLILLQNIHYFNDFFVTYTLVSCNHYRLISIFRLLLFNGFNQLISIHFLLHS